MHRPVFQKLDNTTFRKLETFPSSGEVWKIPTLLGPLERANFSHWKTGYYVLHYLDIISENVRGRQLAHSNG
jgi:hypothetical protein